MPRLNTGNQTGPRVGPRQAGIYPQPEEPGFCPIGSGDQRAFKIQYLNQKYLFSVLNVHSK